MYDRFLRHPFMSRTGLAATRARDQIEAMCRFERALADVQEQAGLIPPGTAEAIASHLDVDAFDTGALADDTPDGANVAIPFVKQAKAQLPAALRPHFHRAATSQDVIDTSLMLLLKPRLTACLTLLARSRAAGAALMETHADTPMIGRTLMQQALPITFGAKVAHWLAGLAAAETRLRDVVDHGLYLQFGGPVGALGELGDDAMALMDALAEHLGLNAPLLPWHSNRQPVLAIGDALDAVAVAAEKIALDVGLMAQTEIGELGEPETTGAGGSSSMPHKHNPVGCARIRAAARQIHGADAVLHNAGAQPFERALGEWQAEWAPMLDAVLLLEGALETLVDLLAGLEVHPQAMRRNLEVTGGAILAKPVTALLADIFSDDEAARLAREAAETARRERRALADVLLASPRIRDEIGERRVRQACDPARHVGASHAQIARVRARLERLP